jgi:CheY-like chemotaxis protein
MISLVKQRGEGFFRYDWTKPGISEGTFPKIAFVKLFKPYQWIIGTVTARTNSVEALEEFRASIGKFGLIITDMTMPNMTGEKLAHAFKAIRPDIPVILCTGFSEKINEHSREDLRIDGFMMKPIDKAKLARTVRKVLDEAPIIR